MVFLLTNLSCLLIPNSLTVSSKKKISFFFISKFIEKANVWDLVTATRIARERLIFSTEKALTLFYDITLVL